MILAPWLKRGGADRAVVALARALLERDAAARVLIVCTQDDAVEALDWAPVSRRLSIARVAAELDDRHDTFVAFANFLRFAGCRASLCRQQPLRLGPDREIRPRAAPATALLRFRVLPGL